MAMASGSSRTAIASKCTSASLLPTWRAKSAIERTGRQVGLSNWKYSASVVCRTWARSRVSPAVNPQSSQPVRAGSGTNRAFGAATWNFGVCEKSWWMNTGKGASEADNCDTVAGACTADMIPKTIFFMFEPMVTDAAQEKSGLVRLKSPIVAIPGLPSKLP
ncbi:MAG: hypothetical protein R3E68_03475 [Burkholderiaceae bacterium]